jgi:hypothetical protein
VLSQVRDQAAEQSLLAAAAVVRVMLEGAANLMAILEDPAPALLAFGRDEYKGMRERIAYLKARFGDDKTERTHEVMLAADERALGLTPSEIAQPALINGWPRPMKLLTRETPPRIGRERKAVLEELYGYWYGVLSAMVHQRMPGLRAAAFSEEHADSAEDSYNTLRLLTALHGVLISLCVLAEIEAAFGFDCCVPLRAAWSAVRDADKLCAAIYQQRYAALLGLES